MRLRWVLVLTHMVQFDLASITDAMANMEGDEEIPQIKLGDASCAAPFTSKLSHVAASESLPIAITHQLSLFSSFPHHQARSLHAGRDHPDVQDLGTKLSHHRIQLERTVSRRHQVWRLPGDCQRDVDVGLLLVHLARTGTVYASSFRCLVDLLCVVQPVEKLSRERPLGNIFNLYVLLSVLIQFTLHIVSLVYITNLAHFYEP